MKNSLNKRVCIIILVFLLAIIAVIPIIVNYLYLYGSDYKTIFQGSDIIEYISTSLAAIGTMILGVVTIRQNRAFKEESDAYQEKLKLENKKAQERLERINKRSNELNSINTILNYEIQRYYKLSDKLNEFQKICSPVYIISICLKDNETKLLELSALGLEVDDCHLSIAHLLNYKGDFLLIEKKTYMNIFGDLYSKTKDIISKNQKGEEMNNECYIELLNLNIDFLYAKEKVLKSNYEGIQKVLYGDLSLDEIKGLFNKDLEDEDNGQVEDADGE